MTRRQWLAAGSFALLLAAGGGLFQLSRERCFSLVLPSICRVETSEKMVALSFDDGPTPLGLDAALPVLDAAGAKATFFVIGGEAAGRTDLLRRLAAEGHELGNHSWTHRRMVGQSRATYGEEIDRTAALIRGAGSDDRNLFRAPYGKKLVGLPLELKARGYRLVMADVVDPPHAATPEEFARAMLAEVRPGSILLIHLMYRANTTARAALPLVVRGLKVRGYRIVPVGTLLAKGRPAP